MSRPSEFDRVTDAYNDLVQNAIGASGESVEFFAELKAEHAAQQLGSSFAGRIMDFGCGIGNCSRALARQLAGAEITGVDTSAHSIEAAASRSANDRVSFRAFAEGALPFDDATFDAAFTACVFHHIDRARHVATLAEILRVLRPGGVLLLFEHNPMNPLTRRVVRSCPFDEGVILLSASYAESIARAAGFREPRTSYYFFFPHGLRALRGADRWLSWLPLGAQYFVRATREERQASA